MPDRNQQQCLLPLILPTASDLPLHLPTSLTFSAYLPPHKARRTQVRNYHYRNTTLLKADNKRDGRGRQLRLVRPLIELASYCQRLIF